MRIVRLRPCAVLGALLGAASLAQAQSSAYTYVAMKNLDCYQINKKIEEGKTAGDPEASYTAAQLLVRRICFKYDPKAYAKLLTRAAQAGHAEATLDLGYAHALGEGVDQDYQRAGELFLSIEGSLLPPETDAYTLGYARAFSRLVRRLSAELIESTPKYRHALEIVVLVDPTGPNRHSVRIVGTPEPGLEAQAEEVRQMVDKSVQGALRLATWNMVKPDTARLKAQPLRTNWPLTLLPPENAGTAASGKVDTYRPH